MRFKGIRVKKKFPKVSIHLLLVILYYNNQGYGGFLQRQYCSAETLDVKQMPTSL